MGSTGVLTRDGLVDPDAFLPGSKHLRPVAVGVSAGHLRSLGSKVASRTEAVASLWTGLGGCYQAPEGEKVLSLMSPAATAGQDMATATDRAASALEAYADELVPIRRDMIDLEGRARAFRDRVAGGVKTSVVGEHPDGFWLVAPGLKVAEAVTSDWRTVPWYEHGPSITENNGLVAEYDALLLRVQRAVDTCAEAVNRVAYTVLRARSAVYSAGALFSGPAEPPAWGYAREEDRNLLEQAYHGVWADAVGGMISGGAMLFGRDPVTGKWGSGDAARQAWGGLGDLLGSLVVVANPVVAPLAVAGAVQDRTGWDLPGGPVTDWAGDRLKVVTDAGGSLIGYDPAAADAGGDGWHLWKDEPARALASSAVNVGTFLVPVAGGVGAGAKGAAAGAKVAGGARVAAEMVLPGGSWLVRGAELAAQGGGALARTGQWSAAVETVRAASGGGRAGLGGVTNGIAQALTDLDKVTPPVHRLPDTMPSVSQSVRPFDAEGLPRPGLDDATVRQGIDSWLYQDAPAEPSAAARAAGERASQAAREPVGATVGGGERAGEQGVPMSGHPTITDPSPGRAADTVTTQPIPGLPRPPDSGPGAAQIQHGPARALEQPRVATESSRVLDGRIDCVSDGGRGLPDYGTPTGHGSSGGGDVPTHTGSPVVQDAPWDADDAAFGGRAPDGAEPPTEPGHGGDGGGPGAPGSKVDEAPRPLPDIADLEHPRNGGDLDAWAEAVAERHGTLTPDEVKAIYRYTTNSGYTEMNGYLRGREYLPDDAARIQKDIDDAVSGLQKLPTVTGETVRGTHLPQSVLDQLKVGERYPDQAFQSTTTDPVVAEGFRAGGNTLISIDGFSGVDVRSLSHFGGEAEVLFSPSARLEVVSIDRSPDGSYWIIKLEEN